MYFNSWRLSPDEPNRLRGQIAPLIGVQAAAAIGAGDGRAIAELVGATVVVGALCSTTGQTTLLSSWEHVISHVQRCEENV